MQARLLEAIKKQETVGDGIQGGATSCPWKGAVPSPAWIRSSALDLVKELGKGSGMLGLKTACGDERGPTPAQKGRRATKRSTYRLHQHMYDGKRGNLAALILDGVGKSSCPVPMPEITSVFSSRWGGGEFFSGLGQFNFGEPVSNEFFWAPISASEVSENLRRAKQSSAAGP